MILIISSDDDFSTNEVIDWIIHYKTPFLRLSQKDFLKIKKIVISNNNQINVHFEINQTIYNLSDFKSVWYRRSALYPHYINEWNNSKKIIDKAITNQLFSERKISFDFLLTNLYKNSLNSPLKTNLNKLIELQKADQVGIKIPYTEIITTKKDFLFLFKKKKKLITKTSSQGVFVYSKNEILNCLTMEVTQEMINSLPEEFEPTLLQEEIEKKMELRIFFIEDQFYASIIFSQQDAQTKIDFRNYNFSKPNRVQTAVLPIVLEQKLSKLMKNLEINSGSIDMIVNEEGEFVFLEVNPIGQFKQVSLPCNYYIEKKIANYLINKNE